MPVNQLIAVCFFSGLASFVLAVLIGMIRKGGGNIQSAIFKILFFGGLIIFLLGFLLSTFNLLIGFELIRLS